MLCLNVFKMNFKIKKGKYKNDLFLKYLMNHCYKLLICHFKYNGINNLREIYFLIYKFVGE